MVTKVKMQVTPDLSKRVQEIVFANGGSWGQNKTISYTDAPFLFIDKNKSLFFCENKEFFKKHRYKEISPYDFITSQGEQKWLPKYGEEALFSLDNKEWSKDTFRCYNPSSTVPFVGNSDIYQHCKPLPKQISFVQFLKDNNAYEKYMNNVKIENQRWDDITCYKPLSEIKELKPNSWITNAFNRYKQKENYYYWEKLYWDWYDICEKNKNNIIWE